MERWVTRNLAQYAVETHLEDYPAAAALSAKRLILDSLGCMFGGCQSTLGQAMLDPIRSMGGREEATLVGGRAKVPTIQAAFVNGTTANALDFDDTLFGMGHPGASLIPAALAVGEWRRASGRDVLGSILVAYDVGDRIGKAIQPTQERLQHVWGVGTWQTFSAVVAAGKVLKLDLDSMLNAFGVAGATAPLPNTQKWGWDLEERPIHWVKEPTGWPSWTGTTAAVLAANGFVGNKYILDGDNGFWIMAGSDRCDWDAMTKGLGSEYEVLDTIAIKPYSSCRWQHPTLDCVSVLVEENDIRASDVKSVTVNSFGWVKRQEVYEPAEMVDAQFSVPYTVAMVLMRQEPGPAWYTRKNLKSDQVLSLAKKVRIEVDPVCDAEYFKNNKLSSRVEIVTTDGKSHEASVDVPKGDPANPMTEAGIREKFRSQARYCLNEDQIEAVADRVMAFEELDDVSTLMTLLTGAPV